MLRNLFYFSVCIVLLCTSCKKDIQSLDNDQGSVDLCVNFKLSALSTPDVSTRTLDEEEIKSNAINSVAICVIKAEEPLTNSKMVAYRIFIDKDKFGDDTRYFFKNIGDFVSTIDHSVLENWPISSAGGVYAGGEDDSRAIDAPEGFNGFVKDASGKNIEVIANFKFDNPVHGHVERLRSGVYYVLAFANFNEEPVVTIGHTMGYWIRENVNYWQRHQSEESFSGIPFSGEVDAGAQAIPGYFPGAQMLATARILLNDSQVTNAINEVNPTIHYALPHHDDEIESESYIHNSETEISSTVATSIHLHNGQNTLNLGLKRLYTRATFSISNEGTHPILISNFKLSNNFSSAATYLYPFFGIQENSPTWQGSPDVKSPKAIVPYNSSTLHNAGCEEVFFDALLVPVVDRTTPLSFDIEVSVPGEAEDIDNYINDYRDYIDILGDLKKQSWAVGEGREFCIRTIREVSNIKYFLKDYDGITPRMVSSGGSSDSDEVNNVLNLLNPENPASSPDNTYIWILEKVSKTEVRIKNKAQNKYIKATGNSEGKNYTNYVANAEEATIFTINQYLNNVGMGNGKPGSVAFSAIYSGVEVYLNVVTDSDKRLITCSKWKDDGAHFYLYPIRRKFVMCKIVTLPVRVFHKEDGVPAPLHELHRNDHLNVEISVSYNAHFQDFEFEVRDWENNNDYNNIEFD